MAHPYPLRESCICLCILTGALPSPPNYIFAKGSDVCVYNGTVAEQDGYPDYQCFLKTKSDTKLSLEFNYKAKVIYISASEHIYKMDYAENPIITQLALSAGQIQGKYTGTQELGRTNKRFKTIVHSFFLGPAWSTISKQFRTYVLTNT